MDGFSYQSMGINPGSPNLAPQGIYMIPALGVSGYSCNDGNSINNTLLAATAQVGYQTLLRLRAGSASRGCSISMWSTRALFDGAASANKHVEACLQRDCQSCSCIASLQSCYFLQAVLLIVSLPSSC
jgi:hypothetical protein